MTRPRYSLLLLLLFLLGVAFWGGGCQRYKSATTSETTPLPPTWTPTQPAAAEGGVVPPSTATPGRIQVPVLAPTVNASAAGTSGIVSARFSTDSDLAQPEEPPPPAETPAPSSTPTPLVVVKDRIDASGPIPLPTVEPLPFGTGHLPTRLLIPALDLDVPIVTIGWKVVQDRRGVRSEWDVADNAAGHHMNTAYPGEAGNMVLSGHNNIGGSVFRSVCVIGEPGVDFGLKDEMIVIDQIGRRFTYEVNGWRRLKEANASIAKRIENAQWMAPTDHAQLTLVTCWPPRSNTHRVIVTGLLTKIEMN